MNVPGHITLSFDRFLDRWWGLFRFGLGESWSFLLCCLGRDWGLLLCCFALLRVGGSGGGSGLTFFAFFAFLLDGLGIAFLDHVTENRFGNFQCTFELAHGLRSQNHIDEYIKTFAVALDGVCQAATPPLVDPDNLAAIIGNDLFDTRSRTARVSSSLTSGLMINPSS